MPFGILRMASLLWVLEYAAGRICMRVFPMHLRVRLMPTECLVFAGSVDVDSVGGSGGWRWHREARTVGSGKDEGREASLPLRFPPLLRRVSSPCVIVTPSPYRHCTHMASHARNPDLHSDFHSNPHPTYPEPAPDLSHDRRLRDQIIGMVFTGAVGPGEGRDGCGVLHAEALAWLESE